MESDNTLLSDSERYLRSDFLRALVHAMRSPLGVARSAVNELKSADADEAEMLSEMATRNLEKLIRLAQQLEWVAEVESGTLQAAPGPCDMASLLNPLLADWDHRARALEVQDSAGQVTLQADAQLLGRTLKLLLDNARRFSKSQVGVAITRESGGIKVAIDDDGPGMSEGQRAGICDRYRSAKTREAASDLALSLSLVQDYLKAQGSTLVLGEAPLGGLRASFQLPLSKATCP